MSRTADGFDAAVAEARRLLGVGPDADLAAIRTSYRRLLLRSHPDLSPIGEAHEHTVRLTAAYRLLCDSLSAIARDPAPAPSPAPTATPTPGPAPTGTPRHAHGGRHGDPVAVAVALMDDETIGIGAPPDEALFLLIDAAERLGDISYLDRSSGIVEVIVEFVEAPTSSIVMTVQGRATGITEVFCTVEPLSASTAPSSPPPTAAVTRLLLDTLVEANA